MEPTPTPIAASQRVAANVRAELGVRRMSYSDFAGLVGWSKTTASARLNGDRRWFWDDVEAAAAVLGVDVKTLTAERAA